jgi:hypothetical protein
LDHFQSAAIGENAAGSASRITTDGATPHCDVTTALADAATGARGISADEAIGDGEGAVYRVDSG